MTTDEITGQVVDCAIRLHIALGPGMMESVYESIMEKQLVKRGLPSIASAVSFEFDGIKFYNSLVVDLLVNERVVVELKAQEKLDPVHSRQVMTYLRLLNLPVGLLINFGAVTLKSGLHRIVNGYVPDSQLLRINRIR